MHPVSFMALPNRGKQPTLMYSLVAPLTPSTRILAKLPTCVLDENSKQVALDGVLSQEECCNVLFDIIYRQSSRHRDGDASAPVESMKRYPATLEKVVLALHSSRYVLLLYRFSPL